MTVHYHPIREWSEDERPREKCRNGTISALSNAELLAILIRQGTRGRSAVDLARELLRLSGDDLHLLGKRSLADLQRVRGIGEAKGIGLLAAFELGRRRQACPVPERPVISSSADSARYLQPRLGDLNQEAFAVLYLNRANKVNLFEIVSTGGITGTVADPRIILRRALEEHAVSLILCHNHPSGSLRPSKADSVLTEQLRAAARLLDITILDHLIVSGTGYYSFADEGLL